MSMRLTEWWAEYLGAEEDDGDDRKETEEGRVEMKDTIVDCCGVC